MPDHVARRVFEPFFTTKGEKGTGLGVPQVGAFMRHIGGHVTVSSQQGRGTTVDLFFQLSSLTCLCVTRIVPASWRPTVIHTDNAVGPLSRKIESMGVSHPAVLS